MAFLCFHNVLPKKSILPKPTFLGSTKMSKKVQKGPEAPKPIFSEGGWAYCSILGHIGTLEHIGTYWGIFWENTFLVHIGAHFGILCDGGSPVVWHADLSTTRSGVRIPPSAGRPTEINHNKSERKVQKVRKL